MSKTLLEADHLRYARLWLWLGILMIATVIFLSLINPPKAAVSFLSKDKLVHCFAYACLMGWFTQIFRRHLARFLFFVFFTAIGIGVEFIQGILPTREFDILDMVANTSGVLLAWGLSYTWVGNILIWFERTCLRKTNFSS